MPHAASNDIFAAAQVHLGVLDDFIRIVEGRLDASLSPFVRDSLTDLLGSLSEQRETYAALTDRAPLAA